MTVVYGGHSARDIEFNLHLDEHVTSISSLTGGDISEHGSILGINVKFGDYQDLPGGTIGHASPVSGDTTIAVRLPRDEVHTFWRAIRVKDHDLGVSVDENNAVTGFGVGVTEGFTGDTDKDRHERVNSMLQRLGVNSASY
jgi:hypothetical protein